MIKKIKDYLSRSEFARKILYGTFFLSLGTVASKIAMALSHVVLANILSVEEYGEYGMIKSTIDNFLIFASMGIGLTTTKYVSELKNSDKQATSSIISTSLILVCALGLIIFFIIFGFSDYISGEILNKSMLRNPLIVGGAILLFISLNTTQIGALLGFQNFNGVSKVRITEGLIVFTGLTLGGWLYGVMGVFIGQLTAMILVNIVTHFSLGRSYRQYGINFSLKNFRESFKTIYKFALPASLSSIIVAPVTWWINTIFVNEPDGYFQLGIYSAVVIFPMAIQMMNSSLSNALLPLLLSKETSKTRKKEFFNYYSSWIIAIGFSIPLIAFPEIVPLVLGNKYPLDHVRLVLYIAVISTLLNSFKQGISRDLIVKNRMWLSVFSMGQWAFTNLLLFLYLKKFGAVGFALSLCISYIINVLVFIPFFVKKKISPGGIFFNKWVILIWLAVLIMIGLTFVIPNIPLRICSILVMVSILMFLAKNLYNHICSAKEL